MLEKIDLNDFINTHNLPKETKFIGYSIHLPDSDEFLCKYKPGNVVSIKGWCDSPDEAKKFNKLNKANRIKDEISNNAIVVWLFDLGTQILATTPEELT